MTEQATGGEIEKVGECSKEKRRGDGHTLEMLVTRDEPGICILHNNMVHKGDMDDRWYVCVHTSAVVIGMPMGVLG